MRSCDGDAGGWLQWLSREWRQFWFQPAPPTNLGACRALFCGALFLFYLRYDFSAWGGVSSAFWLPIWLFRRFHLPVLSAGLLALVQFAWKLALGLSCIGLWTRLSTLTAFVLGVYLLGLPHNFGETSHHDAILVFVLGIMALSRCGDSGSMDAWLRKARRGSDRTGQCLVISGEYTWPIRLVWLLMALIFFTAGVSKIRYSGLKWITSDHLAIVLTQSNYHLSNSDPWTSWGLNVAHCGWLCRLLAAATIAIEVGFPIALFSRPARVVVVPAEFLMQAGIRVLMGPSFESFMICYLFWVRWDRVGLWFAARRPREQDRHVVQVAQR